MCSPPCRDVVRNLLDAGASPLDENKMGYTPLHIAAKFGHTALVEEFSRHGINMRHLSRKIGRSAGNGVKGTRGIQIGYILRAMSLV